LLDEVALGHARILSELALGRATTREARNARTINAMANE
jgi:hypothetical protein